MGWYDDEVNFEPEIEDEAEIGRDRWKGLVIGVLMGVVTLVLIAALVLTLVGTFSWDRPTGSNQAIRQQPQPSQADLLNANYRPSGWTGPSAHALITPTPVALDVVTSADAENLMLINIYERVSPSVVNIEIVSSAHSDLDLDIFDSSGSGFVLDLDGHIVTNAHMVRDAEEILVTFHDGYSIGAELIGVDDYSDLAVIQVDSSRTPLVPVLLGDSNALKVGQRVIANGNTFGVQGSMTVGIVSALGRTLPSAQLLDPRYQQYRNPSIIQVDASVNPGNSGGPLLDSYGQVVGINTAIRTETGGFQGVAFAVPVNTMKRVVPQLIQNRVVQYSWLGIQSPSTEGLSLAAIAEQLGLSVRNGVLISAVEPGSPAAIAGLRAGTQTQTVRGAQIPVNSDIVVAVNGHSIRDIDDLVAYLVENTSPGDTVVLTIVRDGQTLDLDVTLGVRP